MCVRASQECCRGSQYLDSKRQHYFTIGKNLGKLISPRQSQPGSLAMCVCMFLLLFLLLRMNQSGLLLIVNFLFCMLTLFCNFPCVLQVRHLHTFIRLNIGSFPHCYNAEKSSVVFYLKKVGVTLHHTRTHTHHTFCHYLSSSKINGHNR